jgi:hypothetical protein
MSRRHLLTLLLAAAAQAACSNSDRALESRIAVEARKGAGTLVRIASLTDFAWERLHVFGPYATQEDINQELGFAWPEAARTGIAGRDAIALLVFVRDGAVVRYVAQARREVDFADVKIPGGLLPSEAVFVVRIEDRGQPWRVFHLAEPGQRSNMPLQPTIATGDLP